MCTLNGKKISSFSEIFGFFQTVPFLQQDNRIVYGGPEHRRRFIDISCSLLYKNYYSDLQNYQRALKQRNEQIKLDIKTGSNQRSMWDPLLSDYGSRIINKRVQFIFQIREYWNNRLKVIGGKNLDLDISYIPSGIANLNKNLQEQLLEKFKGDKKREDIFKTTVHGVHRDNFVFLNSGRDMRRFSSQGEVRMGVLALKLAFIEYIREISGISPVLLFDDILLEIDRNNMETVLESFAGKNQFLFTSTAVPETGYFQRIADNCLFETPLEQK